MILGNFYQGALHQNDSFTPNRRPSDIVDHVEPVMLIVGSRGIGQLKGSVNYLLFFTTPSMCYLTHSDTASFWARHRII
jgi:hypothetical protein